MSERRCVELTAVFSDGTVMRWDEHDEGADLGAYILLENEGKLPAFRMESRAHVSRPLRKVMRVRGEFFGGDMDSAPSIDGRGANEGAYISMSALMPEGFRWELCSRDGDVCDFEITVLAVPVKGEGT